MDIPKKKRPRTKRIPKPIDIKNHLPYEELLCIEYKMKNNL